MKKAGLQRLTSQLTFLSSKLKDSVLAPALLRRTREKTGRLGSAMSQLSLGYLFIVVGALGSSPVLAVSWTVDLETSSLFGTPAQLAFDLIDGDGVVNNTSTISGFTTNGILGMASSSGGVNGNLPGPVTLSDTDFFNELLQATVLGSSIRFTLDLTTNFAGASGVPDAFAFFVLSASATSSLVDTNLLGDALFVIDADGTATGRLLVATLTSPSLPVSVVPEPSVLLLLALALPLVFRRLLHGSSLRRRAVSRRMTNCAL